MEPPGWCNYHEKLLEENLDTNFIVGTYSVHDGFPCSNFGRQIKDKKTIVYEYGRWRIMKTYISINKKIFDTMLDIFMKTKKYACNEFDNEDVLEYFIPEYKKLQTI